MKAVVRVAILIIVVIALAAIVVWFMGVVAVPPPFNYVIYALLAIGAILAVAWAAGVGS